jgi:hypothetical protein
MPMKLDSKFFDQIRVKGPAKPAPNLPLCQWQGCTEPAAYRAPQGRQREGQYYHFCLDHVRDYNKSYNYFAGMAPDDIDAYQKASATGHRPTWTMGVNAKGPRRAAPGTGQPRQWSAEAYDMFGVLGGDGFTRARTAEAKPERRPLHNLERKSFAILDLEGTESRAEIKSRFKALVKRLHPDANGGDRSSEDRLREIIQAYNHLKSAGFC